MTVTNYPNQIDSNDNLYETHDALRVRLLEDYSPGDVSISIEGNNSNFPSAGIITLTEQNSDIDKRALSFTYTGKTDSSFTGLELLPNFTDVVKFKTITNITQNVMAEHHNILKDALIAIEDFIGVKGTIDLVPGGATLEGRINFLRKMVLTPRAWFTSDKKIGIIPLEVVFTDKSIRLGEGDVTYIWDFGDQTASNVSVYSTIEAYSVVPTESPNFIVKDLDGGSIKKRFDRPGVYDVSLNVKNQYGEDTVEFKSMIEARVEAPNEAQIDITAKSSQIVSSGDTSPVFDRLGTKAGGPFATPPTIRSKTNTFIDLEVPVGTLVAGTTGFPGRSYSGELYSTDDGTTPLDPIESYTWSLSDDLAHGTSNAARASYSIGGIYDIKLRADTSFGSYRITTYENSIDIIENRNLWLFNYATTSTIKGHEFGLNSETFKTADKTQVLSRDDSFLDGTGDETRAKREFERNTGFAVRGTTNSGNKGTSIMTWAEGGSTLSSQTTALIEYEGFSDIVTEHNTEANNLSRPWNWAFLSSGEKAYYVLGPDENEPSNENPINETKHTLNLSSSFTVTSTQLKIDNYKNGAEEIRDNITENYVAGEPTTGRFSVYRTAWKDQSGYILRNSGVGDFFRLRNFYKTEGTVVEPFVNITKLTDMPGVTKKEGQLVALVNGLFFFNNSGSVSAFNDTSMSWETGTVSAIAFRGVQNTSTSNFDNEENTLLAASDNERTAYLSFDYNTSVFIKYNGTDNTFSSIGTRPTGTQFIMGVY